MYTQPEILENIFSYLPTTHLVEATYVCKVWRLEARKKIYQNRSEIIYNFHKWFLNEYRRNWSISRESLPLVHKSISNAEIFFRSFELDIKAELFVIRDRLQNQEKITKAKFIEKRRACLEAFRLFDDDHGNSEKYANHQKMQREFVHIDNDKFNACKELVNFENFLVFFRFISDPDEAEIILDKCTSFREEEEEREFTEQAEDILDYWDDEDPDA